MIAGTIAVTGAFQAFIVNADCEVDQVIDNKGIDITADLGVVGQTIRQGMLISAAKDHYFTSIRLVSGSVIAYFP
jgi:hypothetical protein